MTQAADYPAGLEEQVVLPDGTAVLLRPIREDDGPLLRDLFANMTPEDRRRRFFAPMRALSETTVWRLSHVDYRHDIALLALIEAAGTLLGVVRLASEGDNARAEFAIALRSDFKGHGLWLGVDGADDPDRRPARSGRGARLCVARQRADAADGPRVRLRDRSGCRRRRNGDCPPPIRPDEAGAL